MPHTGPPARDRSPPPADTKLAAYRSEEGALRAQVEHLAEELASARSQLERLGAAGDPPSPVAARWSRVLGGPVSHHREVLLPFALTDDGYAAIGRVLRSRLGRQPTQTGGDLTAPGFSLSRSAEGTRVRLDADWRFHGAGVVSAALLSGLFPGLPLLVGLAALAAHDLASPLHALWALPGLMLGAGAAVRSRARTVIARDRDAHDEAFAAILVAANAHRREQPRVRVEVGPEDGVTGVPTSAEEPRAAEKETHR